MGADSGQKTVTGDAASVNPLASDPELIGDFIMESREHLTAIELQLLTLDQDPANAEAVNAIFRGFHTIKGMAGFLDLPEVRDLAHEVETVLDLARNAKLTVTPTIIDRILESKDYLNAWMTELDEMLRNGKTPAPPEAGGLLAAIRGLVTAAPVQSQTKATAPQATPGLSELAREVAAPPAAERLSEGAGAESAARAPADGPSKWKPPSSITWWTWWVRW